MKEEKLKELVDACFLAKKVTEQMRALPDGMTARQIRIIDSIYCLTKENGICRVGDISSRLNGTTPSVTRQLNELEKMGMVVKERSPQDKRITYVSLTPKALECENKYVLGYHREWCEKIGQISDEEADQAIRVIEALYHSIP